MNIKTPNEALPRLDLEEFKNSKKAPIHVVLDNIRSAQNVGSILRTMDAFRCTKLYLCGITAQPPHREINKTALGAHLTVDWAYYETTAQAVREIKNIGIKVYAVEQTRTAIPLDKFTPQGEIALVLGNEVEGVDQGIVNLCDEAIEISQYGSKHSLNVAVCAGIVIWHSSRQFNY